MKFLKKASLAAAIAAASFSAQAEMVALDDATMSATTGQAGVTIEIEIGGSGISVGEIEYTDEGSVSLQNLTVNNVNGLTQTIDVDAKGNLLIGMTGVTGMEIALGDTAADTTGQFSAVALRSDAGETSELVNNLDMTVNLGASKTAIMNLAAGTNTVDFTDVGGFGGNAIFNRTSLPTGANSGSVAILSKSSIEITDMNVGAFGYTVQQAETRADDAAYGGNGNGVIDGAEQATADSLANGSAVQVSGLKFYGTGGAGTAATMEQVIWAKGGSVAQGGGVYIQMGEIAGTLDIAGISMGGASIGSVKVSDINLAGMTQRIYGH
ncbi:DUF6160 family protein [Thalassolituus pacificus]|uniref:DUF6160 family protein n=1 Tax=Thalassolituus pacificus TaxID=2975440 RepID=A0A9X2WGN3_9GAMM|nr:DUF6160 family protein [Thalassolituus pacificus]MCT7359786.1 DUF6160 family protein [Thalassolituus pacificus]